MLKINELREDTIYYMNFSGDIYIFRPNNINRDNCGGNYIYNNEYFKCTNLVSTSTSIKELRLANIEETLHFLKIEKLDKYIPIEEMGFEKELEIEIW